MCFFLPNYSVREYEGLKVSKKEKEGTPSERGPINTNRILSKFTRPNKTQPQMKQPTFEELTMPHKKKRLAQ